MLRRLFSLLRMFGLSTELITKGKLATLKGFECWRFERQPFVRAEGKRTKRQYSNLFTVANLPLVINSVDKTNIRF